LLKNHSKANRGKSAQQFVAAVVEIYNAKGWAAIQEIPTPIHPSANGFFYAKKSTVDFVGLAFGKHVDFDVKSTKERTSFPLANIEEHQYKWLELAYGQGSVSFILVNFEKLREWYIVPFLMLARRWKEWKDGGRASIPTEDLRLEAIPVREGGRTGLDFLEFLRGKSLAKAR
jgi:recombination protein U